MLSKLADGLGLNVISISSHKIGLTEIHMVITIMNKEQITSISDCEKFHRASLPYLEAEIGRSLLSMEVETPGIQHAIKDIEEFRLFLNYNIKVYVDNFSSWIRGKLTSADEEKITLSSYVIEDTDKTGNDIQIRFDEIHKAKII